jgi:bifunctional UDP-N-acetylglucosamine pyrophosphorylase/glucosamine-1-phosphate N-acetyltransferase
VVKEVPPGALAVSRPDQRNIEGYVERKARRAARAEADKASQADKAGKDHG